MFCIVLLGFGGRLKLLYKVLVVLLRIYGWKEALPSEGSEADYVGGIKEKRDGSND